MKSEPMQQRRMTMKPVRDTRPWYTVAMKEALVVIAQRGFQDRELAGTREALVAAGFSVVLASTHAGACAGKFGSTEQADIALADVDVTEYDRIAFIGGPGAAALADDADARRIAVQAVKAGIVLAAICIAPTILAKAGVLAGKRATVWDSGGEQNALLQTHGAHVTGERVTVDGRIITGNGPDAAQEFGTTFASA